MPRRPRPVSTEEFDKALMALLEDATAEELITIPGLYEAISEYWNNEAIDLARKTREDQKTNA